MSALPTYDPNIRWAVHTVELTYQLWEYKHVATVEIKGNCKGADILSAAIDRHADVLFETQGPIPEFEMLDDAGSALLNQCDEYADYDDEDSDPDIERWLTRMCVGLRIVGHRKDPDA